MSKKQTESESLADDLLRGAGEIALFVHGADTKETRRRIYHCAERGFLPTFKIGETLHARKSELRNAYRAAPKPLVSNS